MDPLRTAVPQTSQPMPTYDEADKEAIEMTAKVCGVVGAIFGGLAMFFGLLVLEASLPLTIVATIIAAPIAGYLAYNYVKNLYENPQPTPQTQVNQLFNESNQRIAQQRVQHNAEMKENLVKQLSKMNEDWKKAKDNYITQKIELESAKERLEFKLKTAVMELANLAMSKQSIMSKPDENAKTVFKKEVEQLENAEKKCKEEIDQLKSQLEINKKFYDVVKNGLKPQLKLLLDTGLVITDEEKQQLIAELYVNFPELIQIYQS